jgi:hypothetical protein
MDSLGLLVEPELLGKSSLDPSLEYNVVCSNHLGNSLHWESGYEIEWSVDVHTELFVKSLGWLWLGLVKIGNLPNLVIIISSCFNVNNLAFLIGLTFNIKTLLVIDIAEMLSLICEDLPPVRVGSVDIGCLRGTIAVDVE